MIPNGSISILDSESASMGLGFQVLAAARAARDGKTMKEIIADVERVKANSGVVFGVPDVKYLLKGGRINHLQRFVAASLKLVPIMELKDSVIKPLGRVINQRKVIPFLIHLVEERINDARPLRIAVLHSDAESDAWKLAKEVRQHLQPDELITSEISPCMGSHVGPEALALAYAAGV
jgi:DegV family protein with EDD domain